MPRRDQSTTHHLSADAIIAVQNDVDAHTLGDDAVAGSRSIRLEETMRFDDTLERLRGGLTVPCQAGAE